MSSKEIVGTVIGLSTPFGFYFAAAPGKVQLYDFVAVDVEAEGEIKRVWAKAIKIERFNPLLPIESGHEIAAMGTSAVSTVISLSREMVTAQAAILGLEEEKEVTPLTYPVKPASFVYIPPTEDIQKLLVGSIPPHRTLEIGKMRGRDVKISIDAHTTVSRHIAIFAMTGAGKSWTCRKILEGLIEKKYPILVFDPHGDYIGMKKTEDLSNPVTVYVPEIFFDMDHEDQIIDLVQTLSGEPFTEAQLPVFQAAFEFILDQKEEFLRFCQEYSEQTGNQIYIGPSGDFVPSIWVVASLLEEVINLKDAGLTFDELPRDLTTATRTTLNAITRRCHKMGNAVKRMRDMNRRIANLYNVETQELPHDPKAMIGKGKVAIVNLSGYDDRIKSAMLASILSELFSARVKDEIPLPFLVVVEEAHNFAPGSFEGVGEAYPSLDVLKTVATEGRKFGVGLILISQRPSRLHPTISSQCNSFIVLRLVNPADQQYIRQIVETIGAEDVNLLPELSVGEALLTGQNVRFPVLAKIDPPKSRGQHEEEDFIKKVMEFSEEK